MKPSTSTPLALPKAGATIDVRCRPNKQHPCRQGRVVVVQVVSTDGSLQSTTFSGPAQANEPQQLELTSAGCQPSHVVIKAVFNPTVFQRARHLCGHHAWSTQYAITDVESTQGFCHITDPSQFFGAVEITWTSAVVAKVNSLPPCFDPSSDLELSLGQPEAIKPCPVSPIEAAASDSILLSSSSWRFQRHPLPAAGSLEEEVDALLAELDHELGKPRRSLDLVTL